MSEINCLEFRKERNTLISESGRGWEEKRWRREHGMGGKKDGIGNGNMTGGGVEVRDREVEEDVEQ